jgi:capsular exopolysaccharide synthesis family protein
LRQLETARAQLIALQARISEISVDASLDGAGIDDIEEAVPPTVPTSPQPIRDAAIASVVGLLGGATIAFWRAGVAARETFDPGMVLGAPLLAQIPDFTSKGANPTELVFEAEVTEAYQFLLSSIEYSLGRGARSILVSSGSPGEGKSLTSLHLARALAVQGCDVTLVDSDIRARGLTSLLNAHDQPGLVALADGAPVSSVVCRYRISESAGLSVIPAGQPPPQVVGLLATRRYRDAIADIISSSDMTIIDSAPLLTVADASAIATQAAGILLVIDARTPESDLHRLNERLRMIPTPVLGYVVNRVPHRRTVAHQYGEDPASSPLSRISASLGWDRRKVAVRPMARAEQPGHSGR